MHSTLWKIEKPLQELHSTGAFALQKKRKILNRRALHNIGNTNRSPFPQTVFFKPQFTSRVLIDGRRSLVGHAQNPSCNNLPTSFENKYQTQLKLFAKDENGSNRDSRLGMGPPQKRAGVSGGGGYHESSFRWKEHLPRNFQGSRTEFLTRVTAGP